MPYLDVTNLMIDPDIAGEVITVVRRKQIVDLRGVISTENTYITPVYCSIGPVSPDNLNRLPDQQYQGKTLSVVTAFRLRGESQGFQPDLIYWQGDYFIVTAIDDYTQYGAGMVSVICTSIDWADAPPGNPANMIEQQLAAWIEIPINVAAVGTSLGINFVATITIQGNVAATGTSH